MSWRLKVYLKNLFKVERRFSEQIHFIKFSPKYGGNEVRLSQIRDIPLSLITNVTTIKAFETTLSMVCNIQVKL